MFTLLVRLQGVGLGDDRVAVGQIQHEERAGIDEFGGDAIHLRGRRPVEQQGGFVAPVVEDPIQHEADGIGRHQRYLARDAEEPAQVLDHARIRLRPVDHFDGGIAPGRSEEMSYRGPSRVTQTRKNAGGGK